MKTFVLIHGSWHSAWNWHRVIPVLENRGFRVLAPDLPGMGRDKTHIGEVRFEKTLLFLKNLVMGLEEEVILVGHSKNGIFISQLAELIPEKIEKLVYLAAYLIPNGKTQAEYSAMDTKGALKPYVEIHGETMSSTLKPEIYKEGLYHDCEDTIFQMAKLILSHESVESGRVPLVLSQEKYGTIPRFYIACTEDRAVTPFIQEKMIEEEGVNAVYKMATSHSPFFSRPMELCEILSEIANFPGKTESRKS